MFTSKNQLWLFIKVSIIIKKKRVSTHQKKKSLYIIIILYDASSNWSRQGEQNVVTIPPLGKSRFYSIDSKSWNKHTTKITLNTFLKVLVLFWFFYSRNKVNNIWIEEKKYQNNMERQIFTTFLLLRVEKYCELDRHILY